MTSKDGDNNGAEHGVEHHRITVVTITFDHETSIVSYDAHGAIISLVQMMIDEARRSLDLQRRQAVQLEFMKQVQDARQSAALAASILGGAGKRH